jgi:DNA topoisomerase-1
VFRTYNASITFQNELLKITEKYSKYTKSDRIDLILNEYNSANAKVAILCNHQKNVSKGYEEGVKKLKDKMMKCKERIDELAVDMTKNANKIKKLKEQIKKYKLEKESKMELKNISLGTSKINYIDPRISVAFLKQNKIPIDIIFKGTIKDKFTWAFDTDENWSF